MEKNDCKCHCHQESVQGYVCRCIKNCIHCHPKKASVTEDQIVVAKQEGRDALLKELGMTQAWNYRDIKAIEEKARARTIEEVKVIAQDLVPLVGNPKHNTALLRILNLKAEYNRLSKLPYYGYCKVCNAERKNGYCSRNECEKSFDKIHIKNKHQ